MNEIPNETLTELQEILDSLANEGTPATGEFKSRIGKLFRSDPSQVAPILQVLQPLLRQLPSALIDQLGDETQLTLQQANPSLSDDLLDLVEEALLRSSSYGRWSWLAVLAIIQSTSSLDIYVRELLETDFAEIQPGQPPLPQNVHQQVLRAFAPLMQNPRFDPDWLFPQLFEGLRQTVLAPVIVDLANFCFRQSLCDEHPAAPRESELVTLLDQLASRMSEVEQDPTSWSGNAEQVSKMISDSVALIVSLCDAMALLQNQSAVKTIEKVCQLKHRRVRAEGFFALAKLGVLSGQEELLKLVEEPVSRLRVIQYADELGLSDQIEDRYLSPESRAEAELALWLSQPNQMGVPPTHIGLIDQRELYWPSYDDPEKCFLFRFEYRLGENAFSNLAIVGPLVHTFVSDLQILDLEDCYAAFAGWQVEHEEIFELDLSSLSPHRQTDLFKLERRLHDFGAGEIENRILGVFFGEVFAVAKCNVDDQPHWAVVDDNQVRTFSRSGDRPLDESLVYSIYVGNKLIAAFNP